MKLISPGPDGRDDASMPYGLIYAKEPTIATEKFIQAVRTVVSKG